MSNLHNVIHALKLKIEKLLFRRSFFVAPLLISQDQIIILFNPLIFAAKYTQFSFLTPIKPSYAITRWFTSHWPENKTVLFTRRRAVFKSMTRRMFMVHPSPLVWIQNYLHTIYWSVCLMLFFSPSEFYLPRHSYLSISVVYSIYFVLLSTTPPWRHFMTISNQQKWIRFCTVL